VGVSPEEQAFAASALIEGLQADAAVGFAVHDEELRFELVSRSLAAINGLPVAEHLGRRVTDILPAPLGEAVEELLAAVRDTGVARAGIELDGTTAAHAGEIRTWLASFHPLQLGDRRLVGVVLVDVSEQLRAARELRESERMLEGAQRMAGLGWWTWYAEDDTVAYAPELMALMGRDPALANTRHERDLLEMADAEERRRVLAELRAALEERRPFSGHVRARRADGEMRTLAVRARLVEGPDGAPVGMQGFVQDITELVHATSRQTLIAELGQAAIGALAFDELLQRAVTALVEHLRVEGAAVLELDASGDELVVRANHNTDPPPEEERIPLRIGGATAHTLRSRQPVVIDDWADEARFEPAPVEGLAGMRSSLVVAIGGRSAPWGVIGMRSTRPHAFGPDDATFAQSVANVIADAVERRTAEAEVASLSAARGRLVAQALDAEERARRTISETLHDGPLQDLLAAGHDLHALRGDPDADDAALTRVHERLVSVVGQLREVMSALHPTVLQYGGLEAALQAVADQQAHAGGFEPHLSVEPAATGLRDELVLSVARELLTNAAKHARARNVRVAVRRDGGDAVELEVADDGIGLTPGRAGEALHDGHIGLASCRERVEAVGGTMTVAGGSAAGTRISARVPTT
jgi:PAS domain S-box-containing protein